MLQPNTTAQLINVFLQSSFGSISDRLLGLLLSGIKLCSFFFFTCKSYCLVCCFLKGGIHLCESARYTIAEYHRLDGMNNRNLLLSSGDWIKYSQIQFPPEDPVSVSRCLPSHCVLTAETERETHTERKRLRWGQGRGRERKSSLAIPSYKNTRTSGYQLNLTTSQRNHLHHHIGHPGFNM